MASFSKTPPQKIAFCVTGLAPGGAENNLVQLVERIDRAKFRPSVTSILPRPHRTVLLERLKKVGVEPRFLNYRHSRQYLAAVGSLTAYLRTLQPALVHSFLFHANCVAASAARRAGQLPLVTGIRVAEPGRRWRQWWEQYATRDAVRCVCVSEDVRNHLAGRGVIPGKAVVIPCGVDLGRFGDSVRPAASFPAPSAGRRWLTAIGRIDRQKRVDRVIDVFCLISRELPDHDLLIVGDGPLRKDCERRIARSGLERRVHIAGWRSDIPEILAMSELLLLSSDWEGMPNVVLEAMATGIPVVALAVPGVCELLGEGAREQVVRRDGQRGSEAERTADFACKVRALACDQQLRGRLGHENRRRAEQQFGVERMVAAHEQLYSELLCNR